MLKGYLVLVGLFHNDTLSLIARALLNAYGLMLAYPEMTSNLIGVGLLVPAVLIGKITVAQPSGAGGRGSSGGYGRLG